MKKNKTSVKKTVKKKSTKASKNSPAKLSKKKPAATAKAARSSKPAKAKKTSMKKGTTTRKPSRSTSPKGKKGKDSAAKRNAGKTAALKSRAAAGTAKKEKKATKIIKPSAATKTGKAARAVPKTQAKAPVKQAPAPKANVKPKAEKKEKPGKAAKVAGKADPKVPATAAADAFPALDASFKRPAKPFFTEVKPGMERVIKRGDKSAPAPVIDIQARRKGPATEESAEELAERIERELQSQSFLKRNRTRSQMCTKCGINAVAPRFTIDRELAYCEICAEILHLGETKEAKRMELNLSSNKAEDEGSANGDEETVPEEVE